MKTRQFKTQRVFLVQIIDAPCGAFASGGPGAAFLATGFINARKLRQVAADQSAARPAHSKEFVASPGGLF